MERGKNMEEKKKGFLAMLLGYVCQFIDFFKRTENRVYVFDFESLSAANPQIENAVQMRRNGEISAVQVVAYDAQGALDLIHCRYKIYNLNCDVPFTVAGRQNAGANDFALFAAWRSEESHSGNNGIMLFPGFKYKERDEIRVSIQATPDIGEAVLKAQIIVICREGL